MNEPSTSRVTIMLYTNSLRSTFFLYCLNAMLSTGIISPLRIIIISSFFYLISFHSLTIYIIPLFVGNVHSFLSIFLKKIGRIFLPIDVLRLQGLSLHFLFVFLLTMQQYVLGLYKMSA